MQEKNKKITVVGLLSYYNGLTTKEKLKLKSYVAAVFELSFYTVDGKFRGNANFSAAELLALQPIIEGELWRQ